MTSKKRTHCRRGHELTDHNLVVYHRQNGHKERQCRKCISMRNRAKDNYPSHRERSYAGPVTIDWAEIMAMPAHPDDVARENALPWERHPQPWDNISPLTQSRNRATE